MTTKRLTASIYPLLTVSNRKMEDLGGELSGDLLALLLENLQGCLTTWMKHRRAISYALITATGKGENDYPVMLQQLAAVIGDLGQAQAQPRVELVRPQHGPDPLANIPSPHVVAAEELLARGRELGSVSTKERDSVFTVVRTTMGKPLDSEAMIVLARLSRRQLHRLPKTQLTNKDRLILKALEALKGK